MDRSICAHWRPWSCQEEDRPSPNAPRAPTDLQEEEPIGFTIRDSKTGDQCRRLRIEEEEGRPIAYGACRGV